MIGFYVTNIWIINFIRTVLRTDLGGNESRVFVFCVCVIQVMVAAWKQSWIPFEDCQTCFGRGRRRSQIS